MTRFHDWPERLSQYLRSRASRPFKWGKGEQDCCSFANGAVLAMTGRDFMADLPDYDDAASADLVLARGLAELIDERLEQIEPAQAQRGDVCIAKLKGHDTVMIVLGDELIGAGLRGLVRVKRVEMEKAWRV